jgi:hypothetical protein
MQSPTYDPGDDPRLHEGFFGTDEGLYYADPDLASGRPTTVEDPILNRGPDADFFRNPDTGNVDEASALGTKMATFTGHRSMLGLTYDRTQALCSDYRGDGFISSWGSALPVDDMPDANGQDLHHLDIIEVGDTFEIAATRLVTGFSRPIDSILIDNRLYVLEFARMAPSGRIIELTFPIP